MFDLQAFIVTSLVNGIKNGTFTKEYGNILAVNYLGKGFLTTENVADIDAQITAWETEINQEVTEEVTEETETEEVVEEVPAE